MYGRRYVVALDKACANLNDTALTVEVRALVRKAGRRLR